MKWYPYPISFVDFLDDLRYEREIKRNPLSTAFAADRPRHSNPRRSGGTCGKAATQHSKRAVVAVASAKQKNSQDVDRTDDAEAYEMQEAPKRHTPVVDGELKDGQPDRRPTVS